MTNWLTHLPGLRTALPRRDRRGVRGPKLGVEALEDRSVPATIPVTSLLDDGTAGTLRAAIAQANENADSDLIDLGGLTGTITLTAGQLTVAHDLTIAGPGAGQLAVSGNHASRVFEIASGVTASISGLTIRDGTVGNDEAGGGIFTSGVLTISACDLVGNTAGSGGGIFNAFVYNGFNGSSSALTVTGCTFSNNTATGGLFSGGGGGIFNDATLTVTGSTFFNNSATDGGGGGGLSTAGTLTVTGSTFTDNVAGHGGGIFNLSPFSNRTTTVTVTGCTISNNTAVGRGGGISLDRWRAYNGPQLVLVTDSAITGNTAGEDGGGIAVPGTNDSSASLKVFNSTLTGNSASRGGGVSVERGPGGTASATFVNVTVAQNTAFESGGGLYMSGVLPSCANTIVAQNSAAAAPDVFGSVRSNGHNLFGTVGAYLRNGVRYGASNSFNGFVFEPPGVVDDLIGLLDSPINPLLGALADNGGPTRTMALLPLSPALGAGGIALAVDAAGQPLTTDQRGLPRVVNGAIDVGAYQTQPQPNVDTLPSAVPGAPVVTLEAPAGTTFTSVTPVLPGQDGVAPLPTNLQNASLPIGAFDFTLAVAPGATATIVIYVPAGILPPGTQINSYYKYNPVTQSWSKFNQASFADRNGDGTDDVVLNLRDGGAGDQDGMANGVIVDPGAPLYLPPIQVQVDLLQPTLNLASQGQIAAAIYSTPDFSAASIDPASVLFAGAVAVQWDLQDVNGDARLDMVLQFRTQDTNLRALYEQLLADDVNEDGVLDSSHQSATLSLTGNTSDDELFEGSDQFDLFLSGRALRDLLASLAASGAI
jgi:predicted outer membrane repeat protein